MKISLETIARWVLSTVSTMLLGFICWFMRETYIEMKDIKGIVLQEQMHTRANTLRLETMENDLEKIQEWRFDVEKRIP